MLIFFRGNTMRQHTLLLVFTIVLTSSPFLLAMSEDEMSDTEETEEVVINIGRTGCTVDDVLCPNNLAKFEGLFAQLIKRAPIQRSGKKLTIQDKLNLFQENRRQIIEIDNRILLNIRELNEQTKQFWNPERKAKLLRAVVLGIISAGSLSVEVYTLLSKTISAEGKIAASIPILTALYTAGSTFMSDIDRIIGNKDLTAKIEQELKKSETIRQTKHDLKKRIRHLKAKLERDKENKVTKTTPKRKKKKK